MLFWIFSAITLFGVLLAAFWVGLHCGITYTKEMYNSRIEAIKPLFAEAITSLWEEASVCDYTTEEFKERARIEAEFIKLAIDEA